MYICTNCGEKKIKWIGICPNCKKEGTYVEEQESVQESKVSIKTYSFNEIDVKKESRFYTRFKDLNQVFGGGITLGSFVLITGDPGVGKSTLLLQILSEYTGKALYVSGEESLEQIKSRALRLGLSFRDTYFSTDTRLEAILDALDLYDLVIIDSIQTISSKGAILGSVSQIREASSALLDKTKKSNTTLLTIGHRTKDGSIAGPKVLEHVVDTVLHLENTSDLAYKILRCSKNRFGPADEIAVFEMTEEGLREISDPSQIFSSAKKLNGVARTPILEGSRALIIEIQALVSKTYTQPLRVVSGLDFNKMLIITALLSKLCSCNFYDKDIYISTSGNYKIRDSSADLALASAIYSSAKSLFQDPKLAVIGEISLSGEIKSVPRLQERLKELKRLGYTQVICPKTDIKIEGLNLHKVENLSEAIDKLKKVS